MKAPLNTDNARRNSVLALLSHVISNVPVRNCAIVKAVKRAAKSSSKFTPGELLLLAFVKVPCAIDCLAEWLPSKVEQRNRQAWITATQRAIGHYGASCCTKDGNLNDMDATYRYQRSKVARSIETTTGLPYMLKQLTSKYTDAKFRRLQEQWKPKWKTQSTEQLAKSIKKAPMSLGGTDYKRTHAMRTLATALRMDTRVKEDPNGDTFMKMSKSLDNVRPWLYPAECSTSPRLAVGWLHRECKKVLKQLGVRIIDEHYLLKRIKHMSRGDECCFVCEAGKVVPKLTAAHTAAMESAVRSRVGKKWRYSKLQHESSHVGVLEGGAVAARALVDLC